MLYIKQELREELELEIDLGKLIKTCLPEPNKFVKLSDFKNSIKANIEFFPSETKLNHIYNSYAKVYGFKDWNEFKKTLIDDSILVRDFKSEIKRQSIIARRELDLVKEKNIGDFEMLKLFRVRCPIFVYTKSVPEGFVPQFLEEETYRDMLFYKNSILQLIPHPKNPLIGILRFYSDDLIAEGNKKGIIQKNIHMNSIIINLDKKFPSDILSISKIPNDCKQYISDFSIPNDYYNPEELFNNIGRVYQGGIYGSNG